MLPFNYADERTIVRNSKDELKTGALSAMIKQLGLIPKQIQDI